MNPFDQQQQQLELQQPQQNTIQQPLTQPKRLTTDTPNKH